VRGQGCSGSDGRRGRSRPVPPRHTLLLSTGSLEAPTGDRLYSRIDVRSGSGLRSLGREEEERLKSPPEGLQC